MERWLLMTLMFLGLLLPGAEVGTAQTPSIHRVAPGDTWTAVAWRYGVSRAALQAANPHPNLAREPVIGDDIALPEGAAAVRGGTLLRAGGRGLWALAAAQRTNPGQLAAHSGLRSPYGPLFDQALFVPGPETPRDLPAGFTAFELSHTPALPGAALALRAVGDGRPSSAKLSSRPFTVTRRGDRLVGLLGSGAFFPPGEYDLLVTPENGPGWSQPLRVAPGSWSYQEITLTGSAAAIDSASIAAERERLFALWKVISPAPLWSEPTRLPVDSYLEISSDYGVRRSYNGGPYSSYHEGVDFAAYGGTPVVAPAGGQVILAEFLYVRGGAVIIDHGLGIYSGFYHMADIFVAPGDEIRQGTPLGEVGTTGLSTGNHLHWDLLVGGVWVDAMDWHNRDMGCWVLTGLALSCTAP